MKTTIGIGNFFVVSTLLVLIPGVSACTSQMATSKDVAMRDGLARKVGTGEIVIFYANETPQSPQMQALYSRISNAAMLAQKSGAASAAEMATLARIQRSYADDLEKFSSQVDKDAGGLEARICGAQNASRNTGLFIFTNRLARAGKARFCLPAKYAGQVEEVDFNIGLSAAEQQDFRYAEMPLSSEKVFAATLDFVKTTMQAKGFAPSDLAYVLITKSHGGGDLVISPKLSYRADLLSDHALAQRYVEVASTVAIREVRLVDLVLENGQRLGDLIANGVQLQNVLIPGSKGKEMGLKIGDLKIGDLDMGSDKQANLASLKVGDLKVGDLKIGDLKVGDLKIGDLKVGDLKSGDLKTGDLKVGDLKIGDLKSGDLKTGDLKISDLKYGDLKVFDLKTGDLKNDLGSESGVLDAPGVSKTAMVEILKGVSLAFPLVFFESCDSDLGADLTQDLLYGSYEWNGSTGVASVYFSDRRGLRYETVNYGTLPVTNHFSESLRGMLDAERSR